MNKAKLSQNKQNTGKKASAAGGSSTGLKQLTKLSKDEKKALRIKAKNANNIINILFSNGTKFITKSSVGNKKELSNIEIYTYPLAHIAWNPKKPRNIIDQNSSFAKKFGDLSSFE